MTRSSCLARRGALAAFLTLATLASRPSPLAAATPASKWASSDAVIYVEMPRPDVLLDRSSDPRLRALVEGIPQLRRALDDDGVRKLREVAEAVATKIDKPVPDAIRALTAGGAILVVEAVEGRPPGSALVVTPGDPGLLRKASDALLELARDDARAKGEADPIKTGDHRGVSGYAVGKGAYAIIDDKLVIADRPQTLRVVVDRSMDGVPAERSIETLAAWKARREVGSDTLAWGFARLDRLRALDPKRYVIGDKPNPGATIFFGGWIEVLRKAPWIGATLTWTDRQLAATLDMPAPPNARAGAFKGFIPPPDAGAPALAKVKDVVLTASLWRDLAALWEARADLLEPQQVQGLAGLDTFAGQFFGGRDFGTGVLGATTADWRLVVALQDPATLKPAPDVKLPAFALVFDLKPDDDDDFSQRLRVAFQSFVGLANIGAAQSKAPPLELLSEVVDGVNLSTTRFMPAPASVKPAKEKERDKEGDANETATVHTRHNFSPSAAQVGRHFLISSSASLARDLIKALKAHDGSPAKHEEGTFVAEADGAALARLVEVNRERLVMQNVLEKGNDRERAEGEVDLLAALMRYLGRGRLAIADGADTWRASIRFDLAH